MHYLCHDFQFCMQTKNTPSMASFKEALKKHSLKATSQRIAIHEAMMELGHASADMVAEYITAKGKAKVTISSVYNTLSQLALLGVYGHRLSANSKMYFDVTPGRHMHLYDQETHEFRDVVDEELLDMVESKLKRKKYKGYKVDYVEVQIVCHATQKKLF